MDKNKKCCINCAYINDKEINCVELTKVARLLTGQTLDEWCCSDFYSKYEDE